MTKNIPGKKPTRAERLSEALRQNLRRRKADGDVLKPLDNSGAHKGEDVKKA